MKSIHTMLLGAALMSAMAVSAESLAVYPDATGTSTYLPLNIYYCSNNIHTQMIYPAADLEAMRGKVIEKLSFTITRAGGQWTSPSVTLKMGTTTQSEYTGTAYINDGLSEVATLTNIVMPVPSEFPYTWEITLDKPFTYTGDNLVLDFTNVKGNGPRNWTFRGVAQSTNTGISYSSSANQQKFLPSVTFDYSSAAEESAVLSASEISFPLEFIGDDSAAKFSLVNTGSKALSGSVAVTGDAFAVAPATFEALPAGESMEFTVNFQPLTAGAHSGEVTVSVDGIAPLTATLSGTAVSGPSAIRTIFNADNYATAIPEGWSVYAEEIYSQNGEFSAGTTNYLDFGSSYAFASSKVAGFDALVWNHANAVAYSDVYTRYYYLVSPAAGGDFTFGATFTDVAATGPYVKAFAATFDSAENIFRIGDELTLDWDNTPAQGSWSVAKGNAPASSYIAFRMKYAALNFFASEAATSAIGSIGVNATENAAPVEYYNIQGMKVNGSLAPGLYIRRQGSTATKVMIR